MENSGQTHPHDVGDKARNRLPAALPAGATNVQVDPTQGLSPHAPREPGSSCLTDAGGGCGHGR
jgi:hypothetical protein